MKNAKISRPAQVDNISQETKDNIETSTNKLIQSLNSIGNVAHSKGSKITGMLDKAESYARKLEKSANKGNLNDALKNVLKLNGHAEDFFNCANGPFVMEEIKTAREVNKTLMQLVAHELRSHHA